VPIALALQKITMKPIRLLIVALLTGGIGLAAGPPPQRTSPPAEASVLVRWLGSRHFKDREAASRQLLRLGRPALPAVRAGLTDPDAEIRRRCRDLLVYLDRPELPPRLAAFLEGTDRGLPPLPGWEPFRALAGSDSSARLLYLEIYKQDRAWLDLLQQGPRQAASQLTARVTSLQPRFSGGVVGPQNQPATGITAAEMAVVFASAAVEPGGTARNFYRILNLFYQQEVQGLIRENQALRKVAESCLARRGNDPLILTQAVNVARFLDLRELLEGTLRPAVIRQLESAITQPPSLDKLVQASAVAFNLGLHEEIPARVKAVVRELAVRAANKPADQQQFFRVLGIVRNLRMQEVIDQDILPAVAARIRALCTGPVDLQQLYQIDAICQILTLPDARAALRPAASRLVAELVQSGDTGKTSQALNVTQHFELPEALEGLVKPAVRKHILATLEQTQDPTRFNQICSLATAARSELVQSTLKPILRRRGRELLARPATLQQVQILHQTAQQLGAPDVTEDCVKPALRQVLLAARLQPVNGGTVNQALQLARELQVKEAVGLALKAAQTRTLAHYTRAHAILHVGVEGTAEQARHLEPLLSETTLLGRFNLNGGSLTTELRDVVLAALVMQSGQRLADYGFSPMATLVNGLFDPDPLVFGFPDAVARDKALARWKKWCADRKKE
jgi:hypothetical protein